MAAAGGWVRVQVHRASRSIGPAAGLTPHSIAWAARGREGRHTRSCNLHEAETTATTHEAPHLGQRLGDLALTLDQLKLQGRDKLTAGLARSAGQERFHCSQPQLHQLKLQGRKEEMSVVGSRSWISSKCRAGAQCDGGLVVSRHSCD